MTSPILNGFHHNMKITLAGVQSTERRWKNVLTSVKDIVPPSHHDDWVVHTQMW